MYGRVVNKHARHNLCFGEAHQAPNYEEGMGTVYAFDEVPLLKKIRSQLGEIIGEKGVNLQAEGNYYYDVNKCGIGFHGDTERKKVIAFYYYYEILSDDPVMLYPIMRNGFVVFNCRFTQGGQKMQLVLVLNYKKVVFNKYFLG